MGAIRVISGILLVVGITIIVGAVGYDDYTVAVGMVYPLSQTMVKMAIGLVLVIIGTALQILGAEE